jgi:hypothetical protein
MSGNKYSIPRPGEYGEAVKKDYGNEPSRHLFSLASFA